MSMVENYPLSADILTGSNRRPSRLISRYVMNRFELSVAQYIHALLPLIYFSRFSAEILSANISK